VVVPDTPTDCRPGNFRIRLDALHRGSAAANRSFPPAEVRARAVTTVPFAARSKRERTSNKAPRARQHRKNIMPQQSYSLAPGGLSDPGTPGGPGFTLSAPEWISIQTYVIDALALPTTMDQFKNSLGTNPPSDLTDFQKLVDAYATLNGHCATWQNTTYPNSVALASDIYNYGTNKAPVFYPPILTEAQILVGDPNNTQAQAALKAILDNLQQTASGYQSKANAAFTAVKAFADQTQADASTLVGPNGDAGLLKYYQDKYGTTSTEVQTLTQQLAATRTALAGDQAEYKHDVIVASTTPTYAWVWPFGTIAAAIVAGIYGHMAVEALDRVHADQDKINLLTGELQADANLINALTLAVNGITGINKALQAALPVLQKIEGIWGGIANDAGAIAKLIDTDIRQVPPIIMNLGVDEAIKAWTKVAQAANQYRLNAYVTTSGGHTASAEAWKVRNLIASPKARLRLVG
jgi:hemolytic enterotoxin HBL